MTTDPDVAKLAQEASDKIVALYVNGPYDRERIVGFIQSAFSPALTALREKLDAAKEQCAVEAENCIASEAALVRTEAEARTLREAGNNLLMVSLAPNDVSGTAMWNEAAKVFREALTPPASETK